MVRVKGDNQVSYAAGDVINIPAAEAKRLIATNQAVPVETQLKKKK